MPSVEPADPQPLVRDSLTGLFSRHHLEGVLPSMLEQALQEQQPLAVAMIDLDHFQRVNDVHGIAAGDTMLASFGALLSKQGGHGDVACRFGGEEFCLLLPGTDALAARRKVNSLLTLWRAAEFRFGDAASSENTFSAGVADSFLAPASPEALLRAAHVCLREAKRLGCHRVLVFDAFDTNPAEAD
jgi:diguanylate cyclase (GGDEF)-like protein